MNKIQSPEIESCKYSHITFGKGIKANTKKNYSFPTDNAGTTRNPHAEINPGIYHITFTKMNSNWTTDLNIYNTLYKIILKKLGELKFGNDILDTPPNA